MKKGAFDQFLNEMQKNQIKEIKKLEEIASKLEILPPKSEIHLPYLCEIINQLQCLTTQDECINVFKKYLGMSTTTKMNTTYNAIRINKNNFLLINLLLAQYQHQKFHKSEQSNKWKLSEKYRAYRLAIGRKSYVITLPYSIERIAINNVNYLLITNILSDEQKLELTGAHKTYKYAEIIEANVGIRKYPTFQWHVKKKPTEKCPIEFFKRSVKLDQKFYRQFSIPLLTNYREKPFSLAPRIPGNNLNSYLNTNKLTITEAISVIMAISKTYENCFANRRYLHRDIKPENILINEKNEINFIDLDFIIKCKPDEVIYYDYICGTPGYIAPEILHDQTESDYSIHLINKPNRAYSQKSDIFALAVVFCSVLIGNSVSYYKDIHKACCPSTQVLLHYLLARMLNTDPSVRPTIQDAITVLNEQIHFNTYFVSRLPILKEVVKYQSYLENQLSPYDRQQLLSKKEDGFMDINLIKKIKIVRELRHKLIWDVDLTKFQNYFHEHREALSIHRDPKSHRFIANIAYFIMGGLLVSLIVNNTYAFWQARGEMVANRVENLLQQPQLVIR